MTRSSSFNGKGAVVSTRLRASSETPPTYPTTVRASSSTASTSTGSGSAASLAKANQPPAAVGARAHKRASPSFPFFAAASVSLPFKSKPPPPLPLEKYPTAPAESSTFLSLSGIKPGQVVSPKTATVEVTSCAGASVVSQPKACSTDKTTNSGGSSVISPSLSAVSTTSISSIRSSAEIHSSSPPVMEHWADSTLLPDLKSAIQELKRFQSGPIKEFPWAQNNTSSSPPLKEPWALAYVQYTETDASSDGGGDGGRLLETGLSMAPSCMAMMMESPSIGGPSRIVTVTKPILVDQVMDSAFSRGDGDGNNIDLDLNVDESDSESMISSEDSALLQQSRTFGTEDKGISILRVNSSQMLSSTAESGTKAIPRAGGDQSEGAGSRPELSSSRSGYTELSALKRTAADRAWKARIQETVRSEADFPEDVRTVARSIFRIIREFDVLAQTPFGSDGRTAAALTHGHHNIRSLLLQGVEQARIYGNHAAAIGFHHSLRVLDSSATLKQLDSSKLLYLLAMPIKHRLEHRSGRTRGRATWEGYAHTWHQRVVAAIDRKREILSSLRIKMYYQTCVRSSRAFDRSLGVVRALSRLNREALRKYQPPVEEWDRCFGEGVGCWDDSDPKEGMTSDRQQQRCDHSNCRGNCAEHHLQSTYGDASGYQIDTGSRRHSGNTGPVQVLRASKGRRSSFSNYMDNVTSRSLPFQESHLGLVKERQPTHFTGSYNPASSTIGHAGTHGESGDPISDFNMDAREVEAVQLWITNAGIHNFLPGDDVFLRFCMEIESVIRGIGLGGTGIQGAGIQQLPSLSGSGSDFFVKEVLKYNGQFVAGMGPSDPVPVSKPGSGPSGVAEFLANSFKTGHASSVPTVTGSHFFSSGGNQAGNTSSNLQAPLPNNTGGPNFATGAGGLSRMTLRQSFHGHSQSTQEPLPYLTEDPNSVYAFPLGPTYALYHPPYSTTTHGTNSSSSSSSGHGGGGMSLTFSPHQSVHAPKDMPEFLRRIQLRLTSFVLSEWLDIFGEVEADQWFQEFLEEMSLNSHGDNSSRRSCEEDEDFVRASQMDLEEDEDEPLEFASNLHHRYTGGDSSLPRHHHNDALQSTTAPQERSRPSSGLTSAFSSITENRTPLRSSISLSSIAVPLQPQPPLASGRPESGGGDMRTPRQSSYQQETFMTESTPKRPNSGKSLLSFQSTRNLPPDSSKSFGSIHVVKKADPYNLTDAYHSTIDQFNRTKSPYQKLSHLFALELLIVASLSYPDSCSSPLFPISSPSGGLNSNFDGHGDPSQDHTKAAVEGSMSPRAYTPGTDAIVNEIENLFRQPQILRPCNLLRDMQLIATFIPGSILDLRDDGKAFWDMALAISSLKTNVINYVVQRGTELVEVGEDTPGSGGGDRSRSATDRSGSRPINQDDEERVRMAEAVRLFTIGK
jgi:hypothetical protein